MRRNNQSFKVFQVVFLVLVMGCSSPQSQEEEQGQEKKHDFPLNKGTNIAHWLSQSEDRGEERRQFFTEEDVQRIADMGFDHIRIPIDESQMWTTRYQKKEEAFQLLKNALNWCSEHGLRAIVDLHILRSHHFNQEDKILWVDPVEQTKFIELWKALSKELKGFSTDSVAYELLNEPVAEDHEDWNNLAAKTIDAIRQEEPERKIVLGSNRWQHTETFDELSIPENDDNIILSFHFYKPMLITHYQASWTDLENYKGAIHYPGRLVRDSDLAKLSGELKETVADANGVVTKDSLEKMMMTPIKVAREAGLQVHCGEFGVYSKTPDQIRYKWYKDVQSLFAKHNVGYANWNYKSGGFGLVNDNGKRNERLIDILAGN